MTGPEHYRKAEELLDDAESSGATWPVEKAQVHAILALAAATAPRCHRPPPLVRGHGHPARGRLDGPARTV